MGKKEEACLVDITKCIGCRACQVACKQWNELPAEETKFQGTGGGYENPPALSTKTRTRITFHEIVDAKGDLEQTAFVKRQCMHCREPGCVSACLVKALVKTPEGPIVWDESLCMGCRYCMIACPFDIPKFEFDKAVPDIQKCTFCIDRIQAEVPKNDVKVNGKTPSSESLKRFRDSQKTPACAKVCPTGALKFGPRKEMLDEAHARIAKDPERYVHYIYGDREVGGTNWLYISDVPFEKLGFKTNLPTTPIPNYTNGFLSAVPLVIVTWLGFCTGLHWFSQRRSEIAETETATAKSQEDQS